MHNRKFSSDPDAEEITWALNEVASGIVTLIETVLPESLHAQLLPLFSSGKMLRARLAIRISRALSCDKAMRLHTAMAVEMVHTASLLHDDIIDAAEHRRGVPSAWKTAGRTGAILLGDLLFMRALECFSGPEDTRVLRDLLTAAGNVCEGEIRQEFLSGNTMLSWCEYVGIVRRKTGALFAFAAGSVADNADQQAALREAGYRLGAAYQLADDVYDVTGDPGTAEKPLGQDIYHAKTTAIEVAEREGLQIREVVRELISGAGQQLTSWPEIHAAWERYLHYDIQPVIDTLLSNEAYDE